ncbi:MAG TPA: alanine racemase [Spirochaetota bacterium]|nr:alanine racemase [Spirochaetota bacterium]HNT11002.1 alanine racemase [Spirochaetota bacterium]
MQLHIETYKNRPTRAEISLPNLRNNFAIVRSIVAPGVRIMAVVKANAYGHGIYEISKELLASGADYLGVAYLEEGVYLRRLGITAPILVMGAINTDQIAEFLENDIEITSSSYNKSAAISAAAVRAGKDALVQLKIDTGMERIGVHWYNAPAFIEKTFSLPGVRVTGIFSHFAKSESDPAFTKTQLERFDSVLDFCAQKGLTPPLVHIANSGGIINHPESHHTMVRPGIMLYGYHPNGHLPEVRFGERALRPVMSLKTKVAYFKVVPPDTGISYNHAYRTKEQTRIVTLPAGYGDGYSRLLTNRGEVVIRGRRYPLVGTVCMDQMMADIGPDGVAYNGDDALLFGEMDGDAISLDSLCGKIGTITYEVLCGISARVPRIYLK